MTQVYVQDPTARIAVRAGTLIVSADEKVLSRWPMDQVDRVMVFGPVQVTPYAVLQLLVQGKEVHYFMMSGKYAGNLSAGRAEYGFLRMAHGDRWRDEKYVLEMARCLVRTKLQNQVALLRQHSEYRRSQEVTAAIKGIEAEEGALERAATVNEVMGVEGYSARVYFGVFGELLRRGIPWGGRTRRPPRDATNALLSLGYTLVGNEVGGWIEATQLEPTFGFLHGFRYGRHSLAQDMLEEFRQPLVDQWVLGLLNRQQVKLEDFEARDGGVYLKREALRRVMHYYRQRMGKFGAPDSWRGLIQMRVEALREAILDGTPLPSFGSSSVVEEEGAGDGAGSEP